MLNEHGLAPIRTQEIARRMRKRLSICGFSEFEYRAMQFSFEHPAADVVGFDVVDALADADVVVVDAESPPAVKGVQLSGRVADAVYVGSSAPPGAAGHLPRPIDPTRILRALADLISRRPDMAAPTPPPPPILLRELPPVEVEAVPSAAPTPFLVSTAEPASESTVRRNAAKAAARAAVRRAQLANRPGGAADEAVPDAMVLDADPVASQRLADLLTRFGFGVEVVIDATQARAALQVRRFAALFLDIALDGSDRGEGLALLATIHALPQEPGQPAPAIVIVSAALGPADRVRASLAGLGLPLVKPVTRGDVARALEARGVALPADARRT